MNTIKRIGLVSAVAFALFAFNACGDDSNSTSASGSSGESYAGRTVTIGNQVWMAENLNIETEDSWCYDDDPEMCAKYGRLYTWDAAMKACPSGWHLPSHGDWFTLLGTLGGMETAGIKLKTIEGWEFDSDVTKNEDTYGFSALPAGKYYQQETFYQLGKSTYFWSSEEIKFKEDRAYAMVLNYDHDDARYLEYFKIDALYVRCMKN